MTTTKRPSRSKPSPFGNVRQTPNGTWQARYKGPDGITHYKSGFATKGAGDAYLAEVRADILRDKWTSPNAPAPASERTLEEYAREWLHLRRKTLRPSTQALYVGLLRLHILPELGHLTLAQLSSSRVRTWHSQRQDVTGPTAVRQSYVLLRSMLNQAVRDEVLTRNPCQVVGAGQPNGGDRPYLSRATAEAVAAQMPTPELGAFLLLKFWACLRLGELLALRVGDLSYRPGHDGKPVMVVSVSKALVQVGATMVEGPPKTKASVRDVPLPRQAEVIITAHLRSRSALPTAFLFAGPDGGPLQSHSVRAPFHRALGVLGLEQDFHLHDLRHGGLTYAALQGATLGQLKSRAGHNSARMVMHYQRVAAELDDRLAWDMSDPDEVTETGTGTA
jgi:integrase